MSYFDCNANLPISQEAIGAFKNGCAIGNVSCKTSLAVYGNKAIEKFKSDLREIHGNEYMTVATSGGSESNSTVINHFLYRSIINNKRLNIVASTVEHPSITEYLLQLSGDGLANITWVKPNYDGGVDVAKIMEHVSAETDCVFLQSVNSETGYVQDIEALYKQLRARRIWLHVDNVQGFMKIVYPRNVGDSISVSHHKIGAPLGIGALLVKEKINPLIAGKQNDGMRGGTYNIGGITSALYVMGKYEYSNPIKIKKQFLRALSAKYHVVQYPNFIKQFSGAATIPDSIILFSNENCLPHTIFFSIVKGGNVLCGLQVKDYLFETKGITIGNGSACNTEKPSIIGSMASSDILPKIKKGFLRVSFNCTSCGLDRLANELCKLPPSM